MPRGFTAPARNPTGTPNVQAMRVTAAQTFKRGALVADTAAGTISECGADPTSVLGVALQNAFSGPGNDLANSGSAVVTGQNVECSVALADRVTVFSCRGVNGGTDPVTPAITNIGEVYGVAKVSDDWVLDLAETVATVCEIVDIDIDNKIFFVKFREAVLALP
jgi:hypothetical protein